MKQKLKTVYTIEEANNSFLMVRYEDSNMLKNHVKEQQLITFTPEEYNQHLKNILSFLDLHTDEAPISYIKREFIKQFSKYE